MSAAASEARPGAAPAWPELIVVVVNWNGRQLLDDCLGSLLASGYEPLQVVLVDNGSQDDSVAHVRQQYPAVQIRALAENRRWAGANNLLIRHLRREPATGQYLLLLNNDTIIPPGSLRLLVGGLRSEPRAWAATPRICYAQDPERAWYDGGRIGAHSGWIRHAGIRRYVRTLPSRRRFVDYGTGCALLLSERALREVGELDEDYHFYGEDVDYCLRLRGQGGRILHVPEAVILHKVSASLGSGSPRKAYLRSRSHVQLLRRHWPRRRWPLVAVGQLLFYGGLLWRNLWAGQAATGLAAVRGVIDELRGAPI